MKHHSPGFLRIVDDAKSRIQEISAEDTLARMRADATLVDVREESEWRDGHVQGALHLGKGVIERDVEKTIPDLSTPLLLYCGGGYRSALAADNLQRMGYTQVFSVAGGFRALREVGAEIVPGD
jgi:rhodanese-related sulfurtransferase